MAIKICENGHFFDNGASPVCPVCSMGEMHDKQGKELPNIGTPAFNALAEAGITRLADLTVHTEKELLALHGFGPKALRIVGHALEEKGLSFAGK